MKALVKDTLKLGFGLMRLPRMEDKSIDIEQTKVMVDKFFEAGGRYFDTALVYEGSEVATKKVLCDRYPRESYYLASKLNVAEHVCKNAEDAKNEIRITLERTGAGYLDFYLLHALDRNNMGIFEAYGLWDYVKELKEEGLIKHYGFSFHDTPDILETIITRHPDAEFVQLQINYMDWEDNRIASRACYEIAEKYDLPVIVMEPVKGGLLANPPAAVMDVFKKADDQLSAAGWAVKFAASLKNVMVVLSGMSDTAQMEDNLTYMRNFKPLTAAEQKTIEDARKALLKVDRIPCTKCNYCTAGCPENIDIPDFFELMNINKSFGDLARARNEMGGRKNKPLPSACIQCGQCESVCPQHIEIMSCLREIAETLE